MNQVAVLEKETVLGVEKHARGRFVTVVFPFPARIFHVCSCLLIPIVRTFKDDRYQKTGAKRGRSAQEKVPETNSLTSFLAIVRSQKDSLYEFCRSNLDFTFSPRQAAVTVSSKSVYSALTTDSPSSNKLDTKTGKSLGEEALVALPKTDRSCSY
jgi:hypothetical protein